MARVKLVRSVDWLGEGDNAPLLERLSSEDALTVEEEIRLDLSIGGVINNQLHALTLDVSQMKYAYMWSNRDVTLKSNSPAAPASTIALKSKIARVWSASSGETNPFGAADVSGLYITTTSAADIKLRFGVDPTLA